MKSPALTNCSLCGSRIGTQDRYYQEVSGWSSPKAKGQSHGGTQIIRRKATGQVACTTCIEFLWQEPLI